MLVSSNTHFRHMRDKNWPPQCYQGQLIGQFSSWSLLFPSRVLSQCLPSSVPSFLWFSEPAPTSDVAFLCKQKFRLHNFPLIHQAGATEEENTLIPELFEEQVNLHEPSAYFCWILSWSWLYSSKSSCFCLSINLPSSTKFVKMPSTASSRFSASCFTNDFSPSLYWTSCMRLANLSSRFCIRTHKYRGCTWVYNILEWFHAHRCLSGTLDPQFALQISHILSQISHKSIKLKSHKRKQVSWILGTFQFRREHFGYRMSLPQPQTDHFGRPTFCESSLSRLAPGHSVGEKGYTRIKWWGWTVTEIISQDDDSHQFMDVLRM